MDTNLVRTQKRFSRMHTKEERKAEKRRYRERKKLLKRSAGKEETAKVETQVTNQGVQTEQVNIAEPTLQKESSNFTARGHQMVNLARKTTTALKNDRAAVCKTTQQTVSKTTQSLRSSTPEKLLPRIHREDLTEQQLKDVIGSGSYGTCYKGIYRGNIPVVIKAFKKSLVKAEVIREARAIQEIQSIEHHPCLPLVIGISLSDIPYLLVTQFHGAGNDLTYTLSKAVNSELLQTKEQWLDVLIEIAKALGFIHRRGWIHNDLKENNIVLHKLLQGQWRPIIIDFGKSVKVDEATCSKPKKDGQIYRWIAPEVLEGRCPPSPSSDIFSLGTIIKYVLRRVIKDKHTDYLFESCLISVPQLRAGNAQTVAASLIEYRKKSSK